MPKGEPVQKPKEKTSPVRGVRKVPKKPTIDLQSKKKNGGGGRWGGMKSLSKEDGGGTRGDSCEPTLLTQERSPKSRKIRGHKKRTVHARGSKVRQRY